MLCAPRGSSSGPELGDLQQLPEGRSLSRPCSACPAWIRSLCCARGRAALGSDTDTASVDTVLTAGLFLRTGSQACRCLYHIFTLILCSSLGICELPVPAAALQSPVLALAAFRGSDPAQSWRAACPLCRPAAPPPGSAHLLNISIAETRATGQHSCVRTQSCSQQPSSLVLFFFFFYFFLIFPFRFAAEQPGNPAAPFMPPPPGSPVPDRHRRCPAALVHQLGR